jgi:DNA-binding response OmpR family regulator
MRSGSPFRCASPHTDPSNVLLVQNDPLKRRTCALVLQDAGLTVSGVGDGAAAWERVEECPPDIVVTDLVLPDTDGMKLCRRLRDDPRTCEAQIFGLSRSTTSADYVRAVKTGFDLLLKEPCDPTTLLTEIRRVRVRAAGLRRRAQLVVGRASVALTDGASAVARSRSIREKYEHVTQTVTIARIRSAYYELPGLKLTVPQAARYWNLDPEACTVAFVELVRRQFLVCLDGVFCLHPCGQTAEASAELFSPEENPFLVP